MRAYNFKLDYDLTAYSHQLKDTYFINDWLVINAGHVIVKKGYSWNGCTLAPDTKETYVASCLHDAMYQFKLGRKLSDRVFYELLKQHGFRFAKFYYISVRLFGVFFY